MKILLVGDWFSISGYGNIVHAYYKTLVKMGHQVNVFPIKWNSPTFRKDIDLTPMIDDPNKKEEFDVIMYITLPIEYGRLMQELRNFTARNTIGVTTLECFPWKNKKWIEGCNIVNSLWVMSEFDYITAINSGVRNPKLILPEITFQSSNETIERDDCLNLLFVGQITSGDRKNVGKLLKVFSKFFANQKARLILKVFKEDNSFYDYEKTVDWIKKYHDVKSELPIIDLVHGILSEEEIAKMYGISDCFITLTHGEGLCLPILQEVYNEKPIIAPWFSGYTGYLKKEYGFFIDGFMVSTMMRNSVYSTDMFWSDVEESEVEKVLQKFIDTPDEIKKEMARKQKEYMLKMLNEYRIKDYDLR